MKVQGDYQRWVNSVEDYEQRIYYYVLDSKGKETIVQYDKKSKRFSCPCEAGTFGQPCGHVDACKEYLGMQDFKPVPCEIR